MAQKTRFVAGDDDFVVGCDCEGDDFVLLLVEGTDASAQLGVHQVDLLAALAEQRVSGLRNLHFAASEERFNLQRNGITGKQTLVRMTPYE